MTPLATRIKEHAASLGTKGQIDLARLGLKLGKKLEAATAADDAALKRLAQEIFGKAF